MLVVGAVFLLVVAGWLFVRGWQQWAEDDRTRDELHAQGRYADAMAFQAGATSNSFIAGGSVLAGLAVVILFIAWLY